MTTNETPEQSKWQWKKIIQYLLQGLLVIGPIAVTAYLIYWFFSSIDSLLPIFTAKDETGHIINRNYGLGFVIVVFTLIFVGFLSSNFIAARIFSIFDSALERAPGIKFIYTSIKDFFEAFAGNKKKFTKAVLVSLIGPDVWQIGFITDDSASEVGLKDHVTVYIPQSYAFAGHLFIVPLSKVRPIEHISAADAMKYAISGGVAAVEEDLPEPPPSSPDAAEDKTTIA